MKKGIMAVTIGIIALVLIIVYVRLPVGTEKEMEPFCFVYFKHVGDIDMLRPQIVDLEKIITQMGIAIKAHCMVMIDNPVEVGLANTRRLVGLIIDITDVPKLTELPQQYAVKEFSNYTGIIYDFNIVGDVRNFIRKKVLRKFVGKGELARYPLFIFLENDYKSGSVAFVEELNNDFYESLWNTE